MSTTSPPTPPADRYGRPATRGLRRGQRVAIAVALVVAVAVAGWLAFAQHSANPISADVVSFRVLGAEEVEVDFQVSMRAGTTAVCTLEALSESFAQVGTVQVPVGPATGDTARYTATLRTSQLADAVDVTMCVAS